MKRRHIQLLLLPFCAIIFDGCIQTAHYRENKGGVFGTYYSVVYDSESDYGASFDSIFNEVNNAINSYDRVSEINKFNQEGFLRNPSDIILEQLKRAAYYHKLTDGAFDPTLMPLIEAWGFGLEKRKAIDSTTIDTLLKLVSFSKNLSIGTEMVQGNRKGVKLDLSALGEGYTLDRIAEFLDGKNIEDYKIEIGGELKCTGVNPKGNIWRIGIANPYYDLGKSNEQMVDIVELNNTSLSTSGNYRKFYMDEQGNKRAHIIDPKTGYPVSHGLLSVSIKCKDAEKADALATACMVLGPEKAKKLISENKDIEGFLVYEDGNNKLKIWDSKGFFILKGS